MHKPFCKAPFVGLTIHPSFSLRLCCSDITHATKKHLRSTPDLKEYFYGPEMNKIREDMKTYSLSDYSPCVACKSSLDGFRQEINVYNNSFRDWNDFNNPKIKYLELTASNICNQSCVMCGPSFSSKLLKLYKQHRSDEPKEWSYAKLATLTEEDLLKIYPLLEDLEKLQLKGGEPFADQNNLKILERLAEVNSDCMVTIISNGTNISKSFMKVLKKIKNLHLSFSLDGDGEVYKWVRGTDIQDTFDTINRYANETGNKFSIQCAVTLFTIHNIMSFNETVMENLKPKSINYSNIIWNPAEVDPRMFREDQLESLVQDLKDYFGFWENKSFFSLEQVELPICNSKELLLLKSFDEQKRTEILPKTLTRMNMFNKIRGRDIRDIVPELKVLLNE